jgi:hypothetical protein
MTEDDKENCLHSIIVLLIFIFVGLCTCCIQLKFIIDILKELKL